MASKDTIIVDLDGTLCDVQHRIEWLEAKQYDEFNSRCTQDKTYPDIVQMLRVFYSARYSIVICTGRSDAYMAHTRSWLYGYRIPYNLLLMRKEGDCRPDLIVKHELIAERELWPTRVLFIIEDRRQVVQMWRAKGYTCLQPVEGNY